VSPSLFHRWGRVRSVVASLLVATAFLQPAVVRAQATPAGPLPSALNGVLPGVPEDALYPRADKPFELHRGGQTVSVRPLKTAKTQRGEEVVADRLLVRFNQNVADADLADVQRKAAKLGAGAARPLARVGNSYLIDVSGAPSLEAAAKALIAADPRVRSAAPDRVVHTQETPNDPLFGQQWNMTKIQAPSAWNRTHGGQNIAILDTGISAHPDLESKIVARKDFSGSPVGSDDIDGHGTHVSGIAAAATNNALGVAGAGYNARLMAVKVLDDIGSGSLSAITSGIYWAADNGANVINMSLAGSDDCSTSWWEDLFDTGRNELRDSINYAFGKNIVLVAAAGNDANSNQLWPAACPNVVSVAATDQSDVRAFFSNFGTWVDVAAPGRSIFSTIVPGAADCQGAPIGSFGTCSGTSMATPHVAGLAALVQSSCGLTNAQSVIDRITSTADAIAGTGSDWLFGRINAARAVCFPAPSNLRLGTILATSVQLLWSDNTPGEASFQVGSRLSGTTSFTFATVPANTTSYSVGGLQTGASYDFVVRACDPLGCSALSNQVSVHAGYSKLTVSLSGSGKITSSPAGINCGNGGTDCSEYYAPGTVVTLNTVPYINLLKGIEYDFDHWEGSCIGSFPTCTLTMSGARSAKAVFVRVASSL
jgi:thermitase